MVRSSIFILTLVLIATMALLGCVSVSKRPDKSVKIGQLEEGSARVCFYGGDWDWGYGVVNHFNGAGNVYVNENHIGYFWDEEVICTDLLAGSYQFHWIWVDSTESPSYSCKRLDITIKTGEEKYLKANSVKPEGKDHLLAVFGAIGGAISAANAKWVFYFEDETNTIGKQSLAKRRIVEHKDLSSTISSLDQKGQHEQEVKDLSEKVRSQDQNEPEAKDLKTPQVTKSVEARLQDLKRMYEANLFTQEEYDSERKELLDEL